MFSDLFNTWLFSGNDNVVRDVMVGGQWQVKLGRHNNQAAIQERFKQVMDELRDL